MAAKAGSSSGGSAPGSRPGELAVPERPRPVRPKQCPVSDPMLVDLFADVVWSTCVCVRPRLWRGACCGYAGVGVRLLACLRVRACVCNVQM